MEPITVFDIFREISTIPRKSEQLDEIRSYLELWCGENYVMTKDTYGNVVITIKEVQDPDNVVVLQSHMDMVCTKSSESGHNFDTDPIELIDTLKNGKHILKANGTTLGADNGMGMAISMALAQELHSSLGNNSLYLLITADEEIQLRGASNLDPKAFSIPDKACMINLDSEQAYEICIGSAGGSVCGFNFPAYPFAGYHIEELFGKSVFKFKLFGLKGGHSGVDINKGRASGLKLMCSFLNGINLSKGISC